MRWGPTGCGIGVLLSEGLTLNTYQGRGPQDFSGVAPALSEVGVSRESGAFLCLQNPSLSDLAQLGYCSPLWGPCLQPPAPQTERGSRGASFPCERGAGPRAEWTLPSPPSTHFLSQPGPENAGQSPSVLGGGLAGLWEWQTSQALPGAQTSQAPTHPALAAAGAGRLGPITQSLGAGPSFSWRVGVGVPVRHRSR